MMLLEKIRIKAQNPAAQPPLKLAFLGDSVTHGCFEIIDKGEGRIDCVYDQQAAYPNRLKRKLETLFPNCPVAVINAGISGGTALHGAERLQRDVLAATPDLTVVCFGLNDVMQPVGLDGYIDGLRAIFTGLRQAECAAVFMTPNSMCTYACPQLDGSWQRETALACADAQNSGKLDTFIAAAIRLCGELGVPVRDCYRDWRRLRELNADTTYLLSNYINHPTREMHERFAARLLETILLDDTWKD